MDEKRKKDPSYEWITLRDTNVNYISEITGYTKSQLRKFLEDKAEEGVYEVQLPLGVIVFTRKER